LVDIRQQLLAAFEAEHREHLEAIRRALETPEQADLREMFRRAHSLKGAARAVDLPQIEAIAHALEDLFAGVQDGGRALDRATIEAIHQTLDRIEALAHDAPAPDPAAEHAEGDPIDATAERNVEFVRVDSQALRDLSSSAHQLARDVRAEQATPVELRRLQRDARRLVQLWAELGVSIAGRAGARARELDQGLKAMSRDLTALARTQGRVSWSLETGVETLREQVDVIALASADSVLGDLGRMVRELAREAGVDVEVRIDGLQVRAERRVLQTLRDPLIHLLRNAVSHGAETPEARRTAGKPEHRLVGLELSSRGGRLQARVYDDGPGPDLVRIEAAARRAGLLPPPGPDVLPPSPEEVLALAFEHGVSSAGAIDRLSGRGMGLSVVQQAVRALGGTARLSPRAPYGAEAVISAPLSTARQTVVLIEVAGALYGMPGFAVVRLLRLDQDRLEFIEGAPVARIEVDDREVVTPVVALGAIVTAGPIEIPTSEGRVNAVLLARGDRYAAFAVDALVEVREMAIEAVEAIGIDPHLALGAGLLEDDTPVVALNPDGLIDRWLRDERRLAAAGLGLAPPPADAAPAKTVLVVDDSITTRTLEKSILEAQGYRVLLAVDGVDALQMLRAGEALFDLVVADIEMPRMDGFALLQAIKADAGLAALPVILMTSRDDAADVRRGMELGAEAYITKQKFDQRELLATIGRIL
jgi:two-component system chemotaxis sensor kinase CheA